MLLTARLGLRKPENNDGFGQDDFNTNADELDKLAIAAHVYNSGNQSIADAALTALTFNGERVDNDAIHDGVNPTRLTCQTAGRYRISGNAIFTSNAVGQQRRALIRLNAVTDLAIDVRLPGAGGNDTPLSVEATRQLVVGDYVELFVSQDSGGALLLIATGEASPSFGMERVG